jgi:hypothetical protein
MLKRKNLAFTLQLSPFFKKAWEICGIIRIDQVLFISGCFLLCCNVNSARVLLAFIIGLSIARWLYFLFMAEKPDAPLLTDMELLKNRLFARYSQLLEHRIFDFVFPEKYIARCREAIRKHKVCPFISAGYVNYGAPAFRKGCDSLAGIFFDRYDSH